MAILQKIRNRAGILVIIFVGVALFLFIIDPSTFQSLFNKQDTSIAKINGKRVDYKEFIDQSEEHRHFLLVAQQKSSLDADEEESIRTQSWNDILQRYLVEPYYEEVGLAVSDAELEDLLFGSNLHSIIIQNFTNPQTGQLDTAQVKNFFEKSNDDPYYSVIADYWKKIIRKERLTVKYNAMIVKGFYVPSKLAELDYNEKNSTFDFEYVNLPYKYIPDEEIKISDEDMKKYYDEHNFMFMADKRGRDIDYVVFNVVPSAEDSLSIFKEINDLYSEFNALENGYAEFANRYSDHVDNKTFLTENMLPFGLPEGFFNSELGTVSNIISLGNYYYFARIDEVVNRPDSVKASHILIRPNDSISIEACRTKAEDLLNQIKAGTDFALIAASNSEDTGSAMNGGDLDWFADGMMVPEFNEACFTGKKGDLLTVETQFGVHIIKITDQTSPKRKIALASIYKEIRFSDRTANKYFADASNFAADNSNAESFDKAIVNNKLNKRIAENLNDLDNKISGIENAREIVRWVYDADRKIGDVSSVFNFPDKFIVAKITGIREKGLMPFENVKEQIQPIVLKNKKSDKLIAELNDDLSKKLDIQNIATKYNVDFDTVRNLSFSAFSVPGLGIEPNLNAVAFVSEPNKISAPIKGNNGVYVIKVINKTQAPQKTDFSAEQLALMRNYSSQVYKIFEALEKMSNIEDLRAKYF